MKKPRLPQYFPSKCADQNMCFLIALKIYIFFFHSNNLELDLNDRFMVLTCDINNDTYTIVNMQYMLQI